MIPRGALLGLLLAAWLASAAGCRRTTSPAPAHRRTPSAVQALRTCVDRWNQANMVDWNRRVANVAVRRLDARERAAYGLPDDVRPGCVVSLIFDRGTVACVIARFGAYWCPPLHDEYGPPLKKNATIDARGVLKLDAPLKGTYPTPPLAWQRYPHVDGYIEPWAAAGKLRPGLSLQGEDHGRCFSGTDETLLKSAISCVTPTLARSDPCFPQRRDWRRGDLAACADGPGYTTFRRWRIAGRAR